MLKNGNWRWPRSCESWSACHNRGSRFLARVDLGAREDGLAIFSSRRKEAVIAISSGEVLEGDIKANKLKLVQAWVEIHSKAIACVFWAAPRLGN